MVARPRKLATVEPENTPFDPIALAADASDADAQGFDALKDFFDGLNSYAADDQMQVPYYTREHSSANWSRLDTWRGALREFDLDKLMVDIQNRFGDGEYKITPMIGGRVRKHIAFRMGDPRKKVAPPVPLAGKESNSEMMLAMMQMQQTAMVQMQQMQAQATQANQQMITGIVTAIAPVLGAIMSRPAPVPPDPSILIASLASALKPEAAPREGFKDMIESAVALKSLIGGEGGGGDDMMSLAGKVLPGLTEVAKQAMAQRPMGPPIPTIRSAGPVPHSPAPSRPAMPQLRAIPVARPVPILSPEQRIVAAIRPAVLQCMSNGTDPETTANLIVSQLHSQGVTDDILFNLGGKFVGAEPLSALATLGLDLREKPEWAEEVIAILIGKLTAGIVAGDDDSGRGDGDASDA